MGHLKLTKDTYTARPKDIVRKWYLVDAEGQVLGRLATQVSTILRGKNKPMFTPNIDTGDHVIVINAGKVAVSGAKADQKVYYRHSGYPGGLKVTPYAKVIEKNPERVIIHAVKGMLPKNKLGNAMLGKLHVYAGSAHPHAAQKPEPLELEGQVT